MTATTSARRDPGASDDVIRAAGAIVWRGDPDEPEVVLVHRPRYDDWSFPKGKLDADEHVLTAAVREVREEAGSRIRLGVPLPSAEYTVDGVAKHVSYWAAEHVDGHFTADAEVDAIVWCSPAKARKRLTRADDGGLLDAFAEAPLRTRIDVAARHAKAESRSRWKEPDERRPLTDKGRRQALVLAEALTAAYPPLRVVTSPWLRCVETVEPYALSAVTAMQLADVLGEDEYEVDPDRALDAVAHAVLQADGTLLCSHGNVMPDLVHLLVDGDEELLGQVADSPLSKGEFVVVHRHEGRAVSAERHRT